MDAKWKGHCKPKCTDGEWWRAAAISSKWLTQRLWPDAPSLAAKAGAGKRQQCQSVLLHGAEHQRLPLLLLPLFFLSSCTHSQFCPSFWISLPSSPNRKTKQKEAQSPTQGLGRECCCVTPDLNTGAIRVKWARWLTSDGFVVGLISGQQDLLCVFFLN